MTVMETLTFAIAGVAIKAVSLAIVEAIAAVVATPAAMKRAVIASLAEAKGAIVNGNRFRE